MQNYFFEKNATQKEMEISRTEVSVQQDACSFGEKDHSWIYEHADKQKVWSETKKFLYQNN